MERPDRRQLFPTPDTRHPAPVAAVLLLLLSLSCARVPETGPGTIRWDRDVCARCIMAVGDRHYAAQVRGGPADESTELYFFDDLGCAVIWLEEQAWKEDPRTEMWVAGQGDGQWIEARSAWYVTGATTPMDYGLGAHGEQVDGAIDFNEAVKVIHAKDRRGRHKHMELSE